MLYIITEGHGYLKITLKQLQTAILKGFEPTRYSYIGKNCALLEEDCDMSQYMLIMQIESVKSKHQQDINRNKYESITPQVIEYIKHHEFADNLIGSKPLRTFNVYRCKGDIEVIIARVKCKKFPRVMTWLNKMPRGYNLKIEEIGV